MAERFNGHVSVIVAGETRLNLVVEIGDLDAPNWVGKIEGSRPRHPGFEEGLVRVRLDEGSRMRQTAAARLTVPTAESGVLRGQEPFDHR